MSKKVYIGIGHGGSDPGAVSNGLKEKDITLSIGKYVNERLKQYNDVETKMSRTTDKDVSIDTKVAESDSFKADVCIDIHINAGGGDGLEIFHSAFRSDKAKSKAIAQSIEKSVNAIGQNSRVPCLRTRSNSKNNADYFGIVRRPDAPSVLIECAFIDTKDIQIVDTEAERKKFGYAIADGIAKYLKLKEMENMSTFKKGDSNNAVFACKLLLLQLKREGIITQGVDANGVFGNGTEIAVKQVQKKAGLKHDGIIDTDTLKAMNSLLETAEKNDAKIQKERDSLKKKIQNAQNALK